MVVTCPRVAPCQCAYYMNSLGLPVLWHVGMSFTPRTSALPIKLSIAEFENAAFSSAGACVHLLMRMPPLWPAMSAESMLLIMLVVGAVKPFCYFFTCL